jgi:hypothetical protein
MKFKQMLISFSAVLFLIFVSCDINIEEEYNGDAVVIGQAVDKKSQQPLDSVNLKVYVSQWGGGGTVCYEDKSDSMGTFRFEMYCSKNYSYWLEVIKDGYLTSGYAGSANFISPGDNHFFIEMVKDTTGTK